MSGVISEDRLRRLVEDLRNDPAVRLVYLFGSRARDDAREGSDTDLGVLLDRAPDWERERQLRARIEALLGSRADVVILNEAGVVLRHEVVTGGRCLLARELREEAEFEISALSQYLDFQPILRLEEEYLRARLAERRRGAAS